MKQSTVLTDEFFFRDVKIVARRLLGKTLCTRDKRGNIKREIIAETEAYDGESDLACHASKGKTPRTSTMYRHGGICYVYLCYGMHWMLNVVTGGEGYPAAVLIRGSVNIKGPGRLTKYLGVNAAYNGMNLSRNSSIWIEDMGMKPSRIYTGPRVGVGYAGPEWSNKPYRFWFSKH